MKSIFSTVVAAVAALSAVNAQSPTDETDGQPTQSPAADLSLRSFTYNGCYSDPGNMFDMGFYTFQAIGWCQPLCVRLAKPYLAFVNGTNCYCGDNPPPNSAKTTDQDCQSPCKGFPKQQCGGTNNWAVWNDGYQPGDPTGTYKIDIPSSTPSAAAESDTGSDTGSAEVTYVSTAVHTVGGTVVPTAVIFVTTTPTAEASSGPNKVAIAVGAVIGVLAFAGILGGLFFFMRHRKRQAIEEERRRHEMMTGFVTGEKPGTSYSMPDSRLEPSVMFQRRQSDGSIADNEDYSRRILKVTNPDGR